MNSRFVIIIFTIVIVAFLAFAGYRIYRTQFAPRSTPATPTPKLTDYVSNGQVRLTIEGPVTANEQHSSAIVTISQNERTMQILKTYDNDVQDSRTYDNNQEAFDDFLHALDGADFTKSRKSSLSDERGQCPAGVRYVYELIKDGQTLQRLWSTSCGEGTFNGTGTTVRQLFETQVPDYNLLTHDSQFQMLR
jgi:hypothetical protein